MPPPGRVWFSGSLSRVTPTGSLLALTKNPAGGLRVWGISAYGRISYGMAWPGWGFWTGSHSLPPVPLRMKYGGRPLTGPAGGDNRQVVGRARAGVVLPEGLGDGDCRLQPALVDGGQAGGRGRVGPQL